MRKVLNLLLVLVVFAHCGGMSLCAESAAAQNTQASVAESAAAHRAAQAGELTQVHGQRVLKLFGSSIKERGFAHGYLLAPLINECLEDALVSLPLFGPEKFNTRLLPWSKTDFLWDADAVDELDGVFEGYSEYFKEHGGAPEVAGLNRKLSRDDLTGMNAIADYFGPACSGFTVWDALTQDGSVLHGRNLDFPIGGRAVSDQVVFAMQALPVRGERHARRAWVGVGWPGLNTVYSALNADGLVCCLHDANNPVREGAAKSGFVPRGLLLRRIVETVDPLASEPALAAATLVAEHPTAGGNLFHLSWPKAAAEKWGGMPAAVLEFDSAERGSGIENGLKCIGIRRMDKSGSLIVTNHFCIRSAPLECSRFDKLTAGLAALTANGKKLALPTARKLLIASEVPLVAHSLIFMPDQRALSVAISHGSLLSTRSTGKMIELNDVLKK